MRLRILKNLAETFLPVVGEVIENIQSKDGGVGRFFAPKFIKQIIRLLTAGVVLYLIIKGEASMEDLEVI